MLTLSLGEVETTEAISICPKENKLQDSSKQTSSTQSSLGSMDTGGNNDLAWQFSWDWDRGFIGIRIIFFAVFLCSVIIAISLSVDNTPANGKYLRKSLIML